MRISLTRHLHNLLNGRLQCSDTPILHFSACCAAVSASRVQLELSFLNPPCKPYVLDIGIRNRNLHRIASEKNHIWSPICIYIYIYICITYILPMFAPNLSFALFCFPFALKMGWGQPCVPALENSSGKRCRASKRPGGC